MWVLDDVACGDIVLHSRRYVGPVVHLDRTSFIVRHGVEGKYLDGACRLRRRQRLRHIVQRCEAVQVQPASDPRARIQTSDSSCVVRITGLRRPYRGSGANAFRSPTFRAATAIFPRVKALPL